MIKSSINLTAIRRKLKWLWDKTALFLVPVAIVLLIIVIMYFATPDMNKPGTADRCDNFLHQKFGKDIVVKKRYVTKHWLCTSIFVLDKRCFLFTESIEQTSLTEIGCEEE